MPPKKDTKKNKKGTKMSIDEFHKTLETTAQEKAPAAGTWGDRMSDEIDSLASGGITTEELREQSGPSSGYGGRQSYQSSSTSYSSYEPRESKGGYGGSSSSFSRDRDDRPPPRARQAETNPLPTEPPFVIYIGNLSFNVTKDDIADFFGTNVVEHIVLPVDHEREGRIKGHGYVEFIDFEAMRDGLDKHGQDFFGRNIKTDTTEPSTAQKMCKNSSSSGFGGFSRRGGEDREFTPRVESVAEKDDNWRGNKGSAFGDASPFGNKRGGNSGRFGGERRFGDRDGDRDSRYGGDRDSRYGGDREGRYGGDRDDRYSDRPSSSNPFGRRGDAPRRDSSNPFGRRGDDQRESRYNDDRYNEPEPTERPKFNLKPRDESAAASSGKQSDLFGGGKAWEETDEIRKKVEQLEMQEKRVAEDAGKKLEEERNAKREERTDRNPFGSRDEGREKKTMDFSKFGKSSNREGEERGGRREYSKKKEEKGEDGFTTASTGSSNVPSTTGASRAAEKKQAQNASVNRFGALGEEDLE